MLEHLPPTWDRCDDRCCDDVAALSVALFQGTSIQIRTTAGKCPAWLPISAWQQARRVVEQRGTTLGDRIDGYLGCVEDLALVEAWARHRCPKHPCGLDLPVKTVI